MPVAAPAQDVVELEKLYLLQNYARHPIVLHRGDGPYMWDVDGKRYLDFIAGIGVNALGQNHPRIVEVIREQAARLAAVIPSPLTRKPPRMEQLSADILERMRNLGW